MLSRLNRIAILAGRKINFMGTDLSISKSFEIDDFPLIVSNVSILFAAEAEDRNFMPISGRRRIIDCKNKKCMIHIDYFC